MGLDFAIAGVVVEGFWLYLLFAFYSENGCFTCTDSSAWLTLILGPMWIVLEVPLASAGVAGAVHLGLRVRRFARQRS